MDGLPPVTLRTCPKMVVPSEGSFMVRADRPEVIHVGGARVIAVSASIADPRHTQQFRAQRLPALASYKAIPFSACGRWVQSFPPEPVKLEPDLSRERLAVLASHLRLPNVNKTASVARVLLLPRVLGRPLSAWRSEVHAAPACALHPAIACAPSRTRE